MVFEVSSLGTLVFHKWSSHTYHIPSKQSIRGGADKSLARPTSRCRWTESIESVERGVCSYAELQILSC